jgi:hypothetical protein
VVVAFVPTRRVSYCLEAGELTHAEKYFIAVHNPFNIASAAFYMATLLISEWFLVRFGRFSLVLLEVTAVRSIDFTSSGKGISM